VVTFRPYSRTQKQVSVYALPQEASDGATA